MIETLAYVPGAALGKAAVSEGRPHRMVVDHLNLGAALATRKKAANTMHGGKQRTIGGVGEKQRVFAETRQVAQHLDKRLSGVMDEDIEARDEVITPGELFEVRHPCGNTVAETGVEGGLGGCLGHLGGQIGCRDLKTASGEGETKEAGAAASIEGGGRRTRRWEFGPLFGAAQHRGVAFPNRTAYPRKTRLTTIDGRPALEPNPIEILAQPRFVLGSVHAASPKLLGGGVCSAE